MIRHDDLVHPEKALLLVVDMQEAFAAPIENFDAIAQRTRIILAAAQQLQLPILATEQYPKGLGRTVEPLRSQLAHATIFEKTAFSCLADNAVAHRLQASGRTQILLAGVETHVCILQTALDLLASGCRPYVLADAVGSRRPLDRDVALQRMQCHGVSISTTEAAILEIVQDSRNDAFKAIRTLIK